MNELGAVGLFDSPLFTELLLFDLHAHCSAAGTVSMVRGMKRGSVDGYDRIADVFIQRSPFGLNDIGHRSQVFIHQLRELHRVQQFRELGVANHVTEERRDVGLFATEFRLNFSVCNLLHHDWGKVSRENAFQAVTSTLEEVVITDSGEDERDWGLNNHGHEPCNKYALILDP